MGNVLFQAKLEGRVGIKKNGKRVYKIAGKTVVTSSQNYQIWSKFATLQLLQAKINTLTRMPIETPINLKCLFYLPNHQGEADLSNLYQGLEDILESIGVIANDKLIYSHDGSRKIFGADRFHVELFITPFVE